MKIALVFPRFKYPSGDIPLGLAYIASTLREKTDSSIELIDTTFYENSKSDVVQMFAHKKYDIVAISCMTTMIMDGFLIAEIVKKSFPETKVIIGGPHPTVMPNETLQNDYVDAVCIGEGEATFLELVNNNGAFNGVSGLWHKDKKGRIIKNDARTPINDLDSIPFPALDLFDVNKYLQYWFQLDSVDRNLKGINIMASRGCPYQCSFCQPTLYKLFGNKIRKRSPRNIVDEIMHWKSKYNLDAVMFQDDTLLVDKKWVGELCDIMIEEKLDVIWGCNSRANLVEKNIFLKMKKAGLRKVNIGIESSSDRIRDRIYNKNVKLEDINRAVTILKSVGVKIQGYFMIGAPTETEQEINDTIHFAKNLNIDEATFSIVTPLPGTYLYEKTKENIAEEIYGLDYYSKSIYNENISLGRSKLSWLKKKALLIFYLSPKHINYTLKSFASIDALKKSIVKLKRF